MRGESLLSFARRALAVNRPATGRDAADQPDEGMALAAPVKSLASFRKAEQPEDAQPAINGRAEMRTSPMPSHGMGDVQSPLRMALLPGHLQGPGSR